MNKFTPVTARLALLLFALRRGAACVRGVPVAMGSIRRPDCRLSPRKEDLAPLGWGKGLSPSRGARNITESCCCLNPSRVGRLRTALGSRCIQRCLVMRGRHQQISPSGRLNDSTIIIIKLIMKSS